MECCIIPKLLTLLFKEGEFMEILAENDAGL